MTTQTTFPDIDAPPRRYTSGELGDFARDTNALRILATHTVAQRALELARELERAAPNNDAKAFLEEVRDELRAAQAEWSEGAPAQEEQYRFICDALRLNLACERKSCRKAHTCRGNAIACLQDADVPELVLDYVTRGMLQERVPSLALIARTPPEQRAAFEGWIAGIMARR
jgi:hypothetical protein